MSDAASPPPTPSPAGPPPKYSGILSAQLALINQAIAQNPQLKVGLFVAAIGAIISVALFFVGGDRELAVLGGIFVVGFMFLLNTFIITTDIKGGSRRPYLATFLTWSISVIFVAAILAMLFSYFFCWPQPFGRICSIRTTIQINGLKFLSSADAQRITDGEDHKYFVIPTIKGRDSVFYLDSLGVSFLLPLRLMPPSLQKMDQKKYSQKLQYWPTLIRISH